MQKRGNILRAPPCHGVWFGRLEARFFGAARALGRDLAAAAWATPALRAAVAQLPRA